MGLKSLGLRCPYPYHNMCYKCLHDHHEIFDRESPGFRILSERCIVICLLKKWNGNMRLKMQFQLALGPFMYSMEKWRHRIAWSEGDRMTKMVYEVSLLLLAIFFWPLLASTNINIDGKWSPWSNLETGMNIVFKSRQLHTRIVFFLKNLTFFG